VAKGHAREQRFTFAQLADQVRRAAHFFSHARVCRGNRVLVMLRACAVVDRDLGHEARRGADPGTVLLTAKTFATASRQRKSPP